MVLQIIPYTSLEQRRTPFLLVARGKRHSDIPVRFENSSTYQQGDFKNLFGFLFLVFHLEVVLTSAHKLTYSSPQN